MPRGSSASLAAWRAAAKSGEGSGRATLEDLYRQIQAGQAKELRIILKADVSGSLGAISHALDQLNQDEIRINVLHEGAGDIIVANRCAGTLIRRRAGDHLHRQQFRPGIVNKGYAEPRTIGRFDERQLCPA